MRRLPTAVAAALLAVLTAAFHLAVLGWDTGYDVDATTGQVSGPYAVWQVVLVGVLLLLLGLAASWRGPAWLVAVVPVVFTVAWSVSAATAPDGDGLWPVGAVLVAVGTGVGAWVCRRLVGALRR
ncbi:hypothetical protein SAMN05660199_02056 [Klenkia soli]|uniref:Uncharacterized protein n=1 Tax=Klenkia soli TaxID=1052260 RepID=A0A1H0K7S6_9ACTN|nr:hypothetical protein [Klenkia soli]SDO51939.1 hypothetical protein SAMN05660199_02056 [Klenkia soli]